MLDVGRGNWKAPFQLAHTLSVFIRLLEALKQNAVWDL